MKFRHLLEISRSEHTILGILWPVEDELVYFTRAQRLVSYYCGMLVSRMVGRSMWASTCALIKTDHSVQMHSHRNTACVCRSGCVFSYRTNQRDRRPGLCCGDFDVAYVASGSADPLDVCGSLVLPEYSREGELVIVCSS